jgi:glycosyltransferase involved in cell wall biosynthesis
VENSRASTLKVLMYSLDKQLFEEGGDARRRLAEYGRLVKALDVVVLTSRGKSEEQISPNVRLYPTNSRSKLFYMRDGGRLGKKLLDQNACDVIVTQEPYFSGYIGWRLAKKRKVKLLVSSYGNNVFDPHWLSESWKHRLLKMIGRRVFDRADAIQTDGFETVEDLKSRYGDKVFWKPIIPANIGDFRNDPGKPARPVRILFVGRLADQKNLPLLVDVMERMKTAVKPGEAAFTLVGDGPQRRYLEGEIKKRHLGEIVRYSPKLDRKEIVEVFASHHVLLLTSLYEGFAKVFMEAAAAGLPIVTTRVSGVANIVRDGETGLVVEQGDAAGLVAALKSLIDAPAKLAQFSRRIQADFHEKYSFEAMIEIQRNIFNFLASR